MYIEIGNCITIMEWVVWSWEKNKNRVKKIPNPWRHDAMDILYTKLDEELENTPDSYFLDDAQWDDMEGETDETKLYYRRKQYSRDAYDNLVANLKYAELVMDKAMEKIKFVGGNFNKLKYAYSEKELDELKKAKVKKMIQSYDDESVEASQIHYHRIGEIVKSHKEHISEIMKKHRELLKRVKKQHIENIKNRKAKAKEEYKHFETEWKQTYGQYQCIMK